MNDQETSQSRTVDQQPTAPRGRANTRKYQDNKNKVISCLFLVKIIAKLKRTQSDTHQKQQHKKPHKQWGYIKQYINYSSTAALERKQP